MTVRRIQDDEEEEEEKIGKETGKKRSREECIMTLHETFFFFCSLTSIDVHRRVCPVPYAIEVKLFAGHPDPTRFYRESQLIQSFDRHIGSRLVRVISSTDEPTASTR